MRRFKLIYIHDADSDPKVIGYGTTFPDGAAVIRYEPTKRTLVAGSLADLEASLVDVDNYTREATAIEWID